MTAGKRKKKPVANPARGFATVSVPSKPKALEANSNGTATPISEDECPPQKSATTPLTEQNSNTPISEAVNPAVSVSDMTAVQFEEHLEDSYLQSLIDRHITECRASAKRQASHLKNERRQLRSQATAVNLDAWNEQTITRVIERWPSLQSASSFETVNDGDSLLLDLWTLRRILMSLDLSAISEAVAHVIQLNLLGRVSKTSGLAWGLEEALDWYALSYGDTPAYDETSTTSVAREHTAEDLLDNSVPSNINPDLAVQQLNGSMDDTNRDTIKIQDNHLATKPNPAQDTKDLVLVGSESDSSVSDEDNDPAILTQRYVKLQTKLWKVTQISSASPEIEQLANSPRLQSIRSKMSSLERDILFDKSTADVEWYRRRIELQVEASQKRRAADKDNSDSSKDLTILTTESHEVRRPSLADIAEMLDEEEDGSEVFGGMFDTDANPSTEAAAMHSNIRITDFGNWTGLPPRQLLAQVVRTIDDAATIKTTTIQATSYSARHKLEIVWKAAQIPNEAAVRALPTELQIQVGERSWLVTMSSIAASTVAQSVEYASLVALFLVLCLEGQDQKQMGRLTGVWRDLLRSLFDSRQNMENELDRQILKDLCMKTENAKAGFDRPGGLSGRQCSFPRPPDESKEEDDEDNMGPQSASVFDLWKTNQTTPAFQQMLKGRQNLPIYAYRGEIVETICQNPVTIVSAETGSGKSTQVGSFLLEHEFSSGRNCRILVTEPRRIAAISLARRVSQELGENPKDLGTAQSLVGYSIRLENKTSPSTRLTFATTGVLLRMLETSPTLRRLDYILLDEVHERTMEMDLLFIALRELQLKRPALRVVLMSATVNAQQFSSYFGNAPILQIPGRTFPVERLFLEDAIEATNDISASQDGAADGDVDAGSDIEEGEDQGLDQVLSPAYSLKTRQRLSNMHKYRIDYNLIVRLAIAIATKPEYAKYSSAILIFMPGIAEIRQLSGAIISTQTFRERWDIHMLHSSFSTEELERAFALPSPGRRKIVIATNIAETGITIPDVTAVIDTAKEKIMRFNERRQLSRLTEGFISRSSAKQRRGRAARVQDGICFHLVTKHRHDNLLLEQQVPEMLRLSLQDAIMRIKLWRLGSIDSTFAQAIEPPSRKTIVRAVEKLKNAGALSNAEDLTPLGQQVARLPLDVRLAKLAILGSVLRCLDPVLTIVSFMTTKSPFLQNEAGQQSRLAFARSDSDLLTLYNAYNGWKKAKLAGSGSEFTRKHFLLEQVLQQAEEQKVQLLVYLVDGGQVVLESREREELNKARISQGSRSKFYNIPERYNLQVGDDLILTLIAMAYYPRMLVREGKGWRNLYNNQQVFLPKGSVNHGNKKPPQWLSFTETMQTKTGKLNVLETSRIPDLAMSLLLGEANTNVFAGVVSIDSGKVRLAVKHWRQALALKAMRTGLKQTLDYFYRHRGASASDSEIFWIGMLLALTTD